MASKSTSARKASSAKPSAAKPAATKLPKAQRPPKVVCPIAPGRAYAFKFPRHNFHGVLSRMENRRLLVKEIRDLREWPIERVTFDIQPLLRRGRFLVTGLDLDINEERSFYVESMREIVELDLSATVRAPITIWIVEGQPFAKLACAEAAAAVGAMFTGNPVPVEKVVIPIHLARRLFRLVPQDELSRRRAAGEASN